jgi:hypothetical protein
VPSRRLQWRVLSFGWLCSAMQVFLTFPRRVLPHHKGWRVTQWSMMTSAYVITWSIYSSTLKRWETLRCVRSQKNYSSGIRLEIILSLSRVSIRKHWIILKQRFSILKFALFERRSHFLFGRSQVRICPETNSLELGFSLFFSDCPHILPDITSK